MTSKAISNRFDLLEGIALSGADAVPVARSRLLDGAYRIGISGGPVEVECLDTGSFWRSVVYVVPGGDLVLRMPRGEYRFWLRRLGDAAPTRIGVSRLGFADRIGFLAAKAWDLLLRGEMVTVGLALVRARLAKAGPATVQAARIPGSSQRPPEPPAALRAPLEPAGTSSGDIAVSIIIPTKERFDLLGACIESLAEINDVPYEIVIVDNGATAPAMLAYLAGLSGRENVRIVRRDIPFNFSRLCNEGARLARNPLLLFLNDDVEAQDAHWLSVMRAFAWRKDVGVVGARLLYPSGHLQHGGIATNLVPGPGHPWRNVPREVWQSHPFLAQAGEVDAVTGACLMIRKAIYDQVGGFDEADFAITLNDVDLCLKVRNLGLKVVYAPQATLWHKESQTRAADQKPEEIERYRRELATFYGRHEAAARASVFYPPYLRRDSDAALLP